IESYHLPLPGGVRARLGIATADEIVDFLRWSGPVDARMHIATRRIVVRLCFVLHDPGWIPGFNQIHRLAYRFHSHREKFVEVKRSGCVIWVDCDFLLQENRAGIDPLIHPKERNAGFALSFDQRPVDRATTAALRQEGRVKTNTAQPWHIKDRWRNDLRHKSQDRQIGLQRDELFSDFWSFQGLMLMYGNTKLQSTLFDRVEFPSRRIGRAEHCHYLFTLGHEFIERLLCKGCLANQDNAHCSPPSS